MKTLRSSEHLRGLFFHPFVYLLWLECLRPYRININKQLSKEPSSIPSSPFSSQETHGLIYLRRFSLIFLDHTWQGFIDQRGEVFVPYYVSVSKEVHLFPFLTHVFLVRLLYTFHLVESGRESNCNQLLRDFHFHFLF